MKKTSINVRRPVDGRYLISSPFGFRLNPVDPQRKMSFHKGIDFAVPEGTPVMAISDGKIQRAGWENEHNKGQGYGFRIWQEITVNEMRFLIVYAHLSKIDIEGGIVKAGEIIASSGNTGSSTGPHLHCGARIYDSEQYVDLSFDGEIK